MVEFGPVSVLTLFLWMGISGVEPLKNVQVIVPAAVIINEHVNLQCLYDLDHNESLYTVKWYLDGEEFYRYVPKEVPPIQVFATMGINVDITKSDARKVFLKSVRHEQTGVYKCEVSADAPFFDTDVVQAQMTVVEFTENIPLIEPAKQRYEVGERIRANCSFGPTRPAANITWFINTAQVRSHFVHEYPVFEDGKKGIWVKSRLEMDTDANSFRGGRLKLKCIASVFSAHHRSSEVQIEEEKPRSASVKAGSNKESTGNQQTTSHNKPALGSNGLPVSVSDPPSSPSSVKSSSEPSVQILVFSSLLFQLNLLWQLLATSSSAR